MNAQEVSIAAMVIALLAAAMSTVSARWARKAQRQFEDATAVLHQERLSHQETRSRIRRAVHREESPEWAPEWHAGYRACADAVLQELERPQA